MHEVRARLSNALRITSFHGRANRREFVALAALVVAFEVALITLFPPEGQTGLRLWLSFAAFMGAILFGGAAVVRRLHDLDLPAIVAFLFVSAVKIVLVIARVIGLPANDWIGLALLALGGIYLAIAPGSADENNFGPAPRALLPAE